MSETASWSYTTVATIYPRTYDGRSGAWVTGNPYAIDCTWIANAETAIDAAGAEFTTKLIFFTELKHDGADMPKPERGWYIAKNDTTHEPDPVRAGGDVIKALTEWDMSPFDEEPDYKIMT